MIRTPINPFRFNSLHLATKKVITQPGNCAMHAFNRNEYPGADELNDMIRNIICSPKQTFKSCIGTQINDLSVLDLTKCETGEIETILKKLKYVDNIKITGLNTEGKLEEFTEALSKLRNVTFNTTQCDLSGNELTDDQFKEINTILLSKMPKLTSLDLSENNIEVEGARDIAKKLNKLTSLDLSENNIEAEGATVIAKSLTNLISLDLSENNIGPEGATFIAKYLNKLTSLNLSHNNIGNEGATFIAKYLNKLTSLNLSFNKIGNWGATNIAIFLDKLTSLNLSINKIGDWGATDIVKYLTNLESLDLYKNNIGPACATALREKFLFVMV